MRSNRCSQDLCVVKNCSSVLKHLKNNEFNVVVLQQMFMNEKSEQMEKISGLDAAYFFAVAAIRVCG